MLIGFLWAERLGVVGDVKGVAALFGELSGRYPAGEDVVVEDDGGVGDILEVLDP